MPDYGTLTEKEKSLLAGCICGDKASWDAFVSQYSPLKKTVERIRRDKAAGQKPDSGQFEIS